MIRDSYIIKNGQSIPKLKLLFIDEEKQVCDGCDEPKICASMQTITDDVFIICKDCLQEIINEF